MGSSRGAFAVAVLAVAALFSYSAVSEACRRTPSLLSLTAGTATEQVLAPGETAHYNFTLTNNQENHDDFDVTLDASCLAEGWRVELCTPGMCYFDYAPCVLSAVMHLKSGASDVIDIHITTLADTAPATYRANLTVCSQTDSEVSANATLSVILPFYEIALSADATSKSVPPATTTDFSVRVANHGNVEDVVRLTVSIEPDNMITPSALYYKRGVWKCCTLV
jgi:uncharacterized membrane protein